MAMEVKMLLLRTWCLCGGVAAAGIECFLFPPRPPLILYGYLELVRGTLFIGTTNIASGRLEASLFCLGNHEGRCI
eukprot:1144971-Pelagomonas_calceolata.AAC.2